MCSSRGIAIPSWIDYLRAEDFTGDVGPTVAKDTGQPGHTAGRKTVHRVVRQPQLSPVGAM